MYSRSRRFTTRRRTFGGFRRGAPLAQRQRYWVQTADAVAESNGTVSSLTVLAWSQVPGIGAMGALSRGVRLKRTLILLTSTTDDTVVSRYYGLNLDDATDSGAWDPSSDTASNQRVPDRVFRWGALVVPGATAVSAGTAVPPGFYTNQDAVRDVKLSGFLRPDSRLFLNISPGATGNLVTWTLIARTLVEIG